MKTFTAQVRVADRRYGNGVGRSKKEAEQAAARDGVRRVGLCPQRARRCAQPLPD